MSNKYYIYWSEEKGVFYSLIESKSNYDHEFHYLVSCFITPKQINKVYRLLIKDSNSERIGK